MCAGVEQILDADPERRASFDDATRSATDIRSCDPDLLKWATRHRRLLNTTHAFDDENPPQQPVNRCWYSANPHWCQASGGRDPATGNCLNAPKADFCSDLSVTGSVREEILEFLNAFK
jgi:hypothetical protein